MLCMSHNTEVNCLSDATVDHDDFFVALGFTTC